MKTHIQIAWTPVARGKVLVVLPKGGTFFELIAGDEEEPIAHSLMHLAGRAVGIYLEVDTIHHLYTWQEGRKAVICHTGEYLGRLMPRDAEHFEWFGSRDIPRLTPAHRAVLRSLTQLRLVA